MTATPRRARGAVNRLAGLFLIAVLAVGCLTLWIGIPLGTLWLLGQLVDSSASHFLLGLLCVPTAMALFSPALFWVNGLYLRVVGGSWIEEDGEERRPPRGPLEPMLIASLVVAIVLLFVWFFAFAKYPPEVVW